MKSKIVLVFLLLFVFTSKSYGQGYLKDCKSCIELSKEKFLELKNVSADFKVSKVLLENGKILDKAVKDSLFKNKEIFNYKQLYYQDTIAKDCYVVYKKRTVLEIEAHKKEIKEKKAEDSKLRDSLNGTKLTKFELNGMDGISYDLNTLKGKVIVLNFWFTKCKPCVEEIEELHEIKAKFKDAPVVFFAVTWNKKEEVVAFLEKKKFDFIHVTDARAVIDQFKIPHYPYNIIISPKGEVEYVSDGFTFDILKKLEKRIEKNIEGI